MLGEFKAGTPQKRARVLSGPARSDNDQINRVWRGDHSKQGRARVDFESSLATDADGRRAGPEFMVQYYTGRRKKFSNRQVPHRSVGNTLRTGQPSRSRLLTHASQRGLRAISTPVSLPWFPHMSGHDQPGRCCCVCCIAKSMLMGSSTRATVLPLPGGDWWSRWGPETYVLTRRTIPTPNFTP
jgi:hypothetical protein